MNDTSQSPENCATIERLLRARERAQSASSTVRAARKEISQAARELAAAEKRAASKPASKPAPAASKPSPASSKPTPAPSTSTSRAVADLLTLPAARAQALNDKAAFGNSGRGIRIELKRAFAAASPSEKTKLLEKFSAALTAFPNEKI